MSPRLKDVINHLYHPVLKNGRQVFALSQSEAEQLPRLSAVALISITAPNAPPAALDGFTHLLRLEFHDVDFLSKELSTRAKTKLPGAFTDNQAALIRSFVENLPEAVHTIIVHCGGGFSRSCAVASCLNRLYGYRVEAERLQQANPSVIQVLMRSPSEQLKCSTKKQRAVAKSEPAAAATGKRLGVAAGVFEAPDDIDAHNAEIARTFNGT